MNKEDDKLCIDKDGKKECYIKVKEDESIISSDCHYIDGTCFIYSNNKDFYCDHKGISKTLTSCKLDLDHGSIISGGDLLYKCKSNFNALEPKHTDEFTCSMLDSDISIKMLEEEFANATPKNNIKLIQENRNKLEERTKEIQDQIDENAKKIELLESIQKELPSLYGTQYDL